MMTRKHLFLVDTISSFRMRYVVEAESLEHAYDEVTMKDSGCEDDAFDEISQKHLGEQIIDGRRISLVDLKALVRQMEDDKSESCIISRNLENYVRKIDYVR
jgi:hypothetical protein